VAPDEVDAPVRLQPLTRARVASLGEVGAAWAASLPQTLRELQRQWSLTFGSALPGGSTSYVVRARTASGAEVVVKVCLPDPGLTLQAETLRRAEGRGYARLLAFDADRGAFLLEALGPSLQQSALAVEERLRLLADTLALAWQPVPPAAPVPDTAALLHALVARLWEELERPCPERVVAQALAYAERRRHVPDGERVVVHGDAHPGNLLQLSAAASRGTGWCFVDPDGVVADRAYDLGVALRDWSAQLTGPGARARLERWCGLLAERSGVDATRIWEWAYLERVSTGLFVRSFGAERAAQPYLRTAELLLD
jgi:streptomycin 6-kinase